jgi:hypothetical protein
MTEEESRTLFDRIKKAMEAAVKEVYDEARKTGEELVVSDGKGGVKRIRVK